MEFSIRNLRANLNLNSKSNRWWWWWWRDMNKMTKMDVSWIVYMNVCVCVCSCDVNFVWLQIKVYVNLNKIDGLFCTNDSHIHKSLTVHVFSFFFFFSLFLVRVSFLFRVHSFFLRFNDGKIKMSNKRKRGNEWHNTIRSIVWV